MSGCAPRTRRSCSRPPEGSCVSALQLDIAGTYRLLAQAFHAYILGGSIRSGPGRATIPCRAPRSAGRELPTAQVNVQKATRRGRAASPIPCVSMARFTALTQPAARFLPRIAQGTVKARLPDARQVLTFAIPYYARLDYLRQAIASVFRQSSPCWELIVCDDSGGEAEDLVASYGDARLKYYKNPCRLGMVANWNRCLDLARTDLVTLLHADDELLD